ncbi:MAG TPA: hypothetical protein VK437_09975 [Steroidobacteraceae bacterium]|nr:hypothetical protein [Steroidobacteraceae bacterium]
MIGRLPRGLKLALVAALIAAYAGLSHYSNTQEARTLGAALALGPLLAGPALVARRAGRLAATLTAVAAALLSYACWPLLEKNFSVAYLLQECGIYGLLAVGFARSLRPGETALCTQLADRLHGPLTPREVRYTRQVTLAWAVFFVAITVATLSLYLAAPLSLWSAFVNFVTLPLVASMFILEYAVRRHVLPQTDHRGILATMQAFFASR